MGEQVENQQQTQVLLLNGQTIILEGDVGENSINEINAEILEQALQETPSNINNRQPTNHNPTAGVSNNNLAINQVSTEAVPQENVMGEFEGTDANNFVAIFENENGETQTVQLTLEQAAALGFQVTTEVAEPENKKQQHAEGSSSMVLPAEGTKTTAQNLTPSLTQSTAPETSILGSILKTTASPIVSVVPQYVNNTMSYSVKMPESMELNTNMADFLPSTAQGATTMAASASPHTIDMSRAPSNVQKPSTTVDPSQSVVRLKTPNTAVASSTAIIRPMTSKTVIPKIQGTPTSMSNLTMSTALPLSSTASMVRVLNSTATSAAKSSTVTSVATTQVKNIDTSSVPLVAANATKPLGSSENPIQLVQHGQTFHSMQPLSQEQLKQIATVLQQKQLDTSRNSKNVLYDATTNTRIIYRVVYPEDLALKKPTHTVSSAKGRGGTTVGGRKGRPPKSSPKGTGTRRASDDEEDLPLDTDLSKGEKEERKKVLPRTRSGRLSRPPRHMVKDYKRIHHLDFAEPDLDDSDGGYSDYRISDTEAQEANLDPAAVSGEASQQQTQQETQETVSENAVNPDTTDMSENKRSSFNKFRCPTCHKMYLGYRRLARHFESYPDHGSMDSVPRGPSKSADGEKGSDALNGGESSSANKYRLKRRGAHLMLTPLMKAEKRKARLTELLAGYSAAEIAEIAGPMVAESLDIWQLLLMKVATKKEQPSRLTTLLAELKTLLGTARSRVAEVLSTNSMIHTDASQPVEVTDTTVATALNISCGVYNVMDIDDRRLQWRPSGFNLQSSNSSALAPESLPQPHSGQSPAAKKLKLWTEDKAADRQSEKSFLDTTAESEKPSDTSMGSDTPLDDIVHAELKKSGLEDFVVPPPVVTSSLGHSQVVDFVTFSSAVQDSGSHFPSELVMNMPSVVVTSDSSLSKMEHFQLPARSSSSATARLDLSGTGIDVHLDTQLEEPTHELDFEALSEEFNRNTNS